MTTDSTRISDLFLRVRPFAGSVASRIGASNTLLFGGASCILGGLLFARKLPALRKMVRPSNPQGGFHEDLKTAGQIAVHNMIDYLVDIKGLPSREEAYCLCTLAIEMRVIEVVDGNAGIAMLLPKSIFKETG